MTNLVKDLIDVLKEHKVVDEHSLRDFQIRQRYKELRSQKKENGKHLHSCKKAREIVSEEFFLSEKRIQAIIYSEI